MTTRTLLHNVGIAGTLTCGVVCSFGQTAVDYERQVHPILAAKCGACHGKAKREGGLSLATYADALEGGRSGATITPGNAKASPLMQRITGEMQPRMPLGGRPLPDVEVAVIRSWIDQGARATPTSAAAKPKWEAPLALDRPKIPDQVWKNWTAPVDRFAAAYLANSSISPPQAVSDGQFARRAYLDIWGLLPDPEALRAFISDRTLEKREKLVTQLLSDGDKYAEHWISFWNDLLRNDEGVTYHSETASRKSITDWLLTALQSNLPYDQFVSKLLNPAAPSDPEGFLIGVNWRGTVSASQTPAMQAAQNTAQIFLGINLKCNSCHDSFVSKWKLKQAYAMASYFSADPKLQLFRCDIAQQEFAQPAFLYPQLDRKPASDSLVDRRTTAAAIFTDPRNGRLPRTLVNRVWLRLLGRGLVNDPDDMDGEPWSAPLLDWLASDFVEHGYDLKHLIGTIVSSRTYQMSAVRRTGDQPRQYAFRGPEIRRMTAEQFADAIGAITGEWHTYQPSPGARTAQSAARVPEALSTRNLSGAAHSGIADPGTPGVEAARAKALASGAADPAPAPQTSSARVVSTSEPRATEPSLYTREWRVAASPLARALGRPIRDQVYSTRESQATTLQALELVNGNALTHWLARGARKMLGELPSEPVSVFDKPMRGRGTPVQFDIDISGAKKLWLLVEDTGSYSPEKVEAVWADVELVGSVGGVPLSSLKPVDDSGLRRNTQPAGAGENTGHDVRVKTPSRVVYDISSGAYTRLRGAIALENRVVTSEINPQIRFFIFRDEPNMERLTPVADSTPLPPGPRLRSAAEIVDRVFWFALGRPPSADERRDAESAINDASRPGRVSSAGLADLLWAVFMKPEFQLVY